MSIFNKFRKQRKEKIAKKAIDHSSLGIFTTGDKHNKPRLKSGGHGEENIKALKKLNTEYNVVKKYPNGVRLGNIPSHKNVYKRTGTIHTWFPKSWSRKTIKKAGEKVIKSIPYKLPDGENMFEPIKT